MSASMDLFEAQSKVTSSDRSEIESVKTSEEGTPNFSLKDSAVSTSETGIRYWILGLDRLGFCLKFSENNYFCGRVHFLGSGHCEGFVISCCWDIISERLGEIRLYRLLLWNLFDPKL